MLTIKFTQDWSPFCSDPVIMARRTLGVVKTEQNRTLLRSDRSSTAYEERKTYLFVMRRH